MVIITTADADNNEIEAVHTNTNTDIIGGDSPVENNNNTLESGSALAGEGEEDNNDMEAGADPDADLSEASIGGIGHHRPRKGQDQAGQDTSPRSSKRNWKVYLFIAVLFVCGIIGLVEFKKKSNLITSTENKDIDIIDDTLQVGTTKSSKRGKSSKRSKNRVKCGDIVHGMISLRDDLVCEQGEGENDGIPNAAITLDGPEAVLNCEGFMITQDVADGAATGCDALDFYGGNLEEDPTKVQEIKNDCFLHFLYGIVLLNGAKAVGCNIEKFLVGAYFGLEAEELHNVTASNNAYGVVAETNATAKITNLTVKDNREVGIRASNNGESIFVGDYEPGGSMELKDITATGNGDDGIYFIRGVGIEIAGSDIDVIDAVATGNDFGIYIFDSEEIDVKNIEANDNAFYGIYINTSDDISLIDTVANDNDDGGISISISNKIDLQNFEGNNNGGYGIGISSNLDLELTLKGSVSLNDNGRDGLNVKFSDGSITLLGSISLNDNGRDGLYVEDSEGSIALFGDLEANDNGNIGISLSGSDSDIFDIVTFSIDDGASLSACGNKGDDDIIIGSGSSLTLVPGGTCTGSTSGVGTFPVPVCNACPPTPLI